MKKAFKIGLCNHKGGVAKTTTVINVTYYLQKESIRVLTVDCDSQRNCFAFLARDDGRFNSTRYATV
jgi:cellulose biosynthesis protein BcsQ